MNKIGIVLVFLLIPLSHLDAQIRLRTPEGKFVLLFDNGTWKYEETKPVIQEMKEVAPLQMKEEAEKPINFKTASLDAQTVIKGTSAKLSKFSKTNNVVKCDFALVSTKEKAILHTNWKIMDGEGFRFFGYITKKSKMELELSNGETIILQYQQDFAPKEYPQYGFTTFTAELELSKEQIQKLQAAYLQKVNMYWSRRVESYDIFNPDYFIKAIPEITE
ncbi:hypothetical protein [Ancylomarina longa]|uniref:Uncharacterized protein n=1 Tax=Ancylomarina longa TaxID=2487017 RepID=A0A434AVE0_9BACT|nr:hypothetical protein [Ancylomarina longa]RUT78324.1 hypothetical protein DLK05_08330 [Ancylomarina longa]